MDNDELYRAYKIGLYDCQCENGGLYVLDSGLPYSVGVGRVGIYMGNTLKTNINDWYIIGAASYKVRYTEDGLEYIDIISVREWVKYIDNVINNALKGSLNVSLLEKHIDGYTIYKVGCINSKERYDKWEAKMELIGELDKYRLA